MNNVHRSHQLKKRFGVFAGENLIPQYFTGSYYRLILILSIKSGHLSGFEYESIGIPAHSIPRSIRLPGPFVEKRSRTIVYYIDHFLRSLHVVKICGGFLQYNLNKIIIRVPNRIDMMNDFFELRNSDFP